MSIRRTRQEKEHPHHQFTLSWQPVVKSHFNSQPEGKTLRAYEAKRAVGLAKEDDSEPIRHDIIKSLILASLILASELVIYLGWFRSLS